MSYVLVIFMVFGYRGGAAIDHIEGFKTMGDCTDAAMTLKSFSVPYGSEPAIKVYCVKKP